MSRQIKIILGIFTVLLLLIIANLSWVQIFGAQKIADNTANNRGMVSQYAIQRGEILTADGEVAAQSVQTTSQYKYQRVYPMGPLFANLTGYDSWRYGRTGLEKKFNQDLLGEGNTTFRSWLNGLLGKSRKGNTIVMTADSRLQRTATEALGKQKGAVVALDPQTGAVLACVTYPTYNPNLAVPGSNDDKQAAWNALIADPNQPFVDRATEGLYPPGSSFKVVTAAGALDDGTVTPDSQFDCTGTYHIPQFGNHSIPDFNTRGHGQISFETALIVSCNVTFAQVAIKMGAPAFVAAAEAFGFNKVIPFTLPVAKTHIQSASSMDLLALASAGIGQGQDLASPLQMALVAAAVADGGKIMKPYAVSEVQDYNGTTLQRFGPQEWGSAMKEETSATLTDMMVQVVSKGTGTAARIDGVDVAGKTGTAETGVEGQAHAWFISFAPANDPKIAVAVIVENGGEGGAVAAPIARQVMEEALSQSK